MIFFSLLIRVTADGELDEQIKNILRIRSREDLTQASPTGINPAYFFTIVSEAIHM